MTGIILLLFIITSVFIFTLVLDVTSDEQLNSSLVILDIQYTDNGNVIIQHQRGPSIDSDNLKIIVDEEEVDYIFEDNQQFSQSDSVVFNEKPNGEEFEGGERINVYVGDSESKIATKIIP